MKIVDRIASRKPVFQRYFYTQKTEMALHRRIFLYRPELPRIRDLKTCFLLPVRNVKNSYRWIERLWSAPVYIVIDVVRNGSSRQPSHCALIMRSMLILMTLNIQSVRAPEARSGPASNLGSIGWRSMRLSEDLFMQKNALCPECDAEIRFNDMPIIDQRTLCPCCGSDLIVVGLNPIVFDWAFLEPLPRPERGGLLDVRPRNPWDDN
jgi:lysine biosynthesis protein LysW